MNRLHQSAVSFLHSFVINIHFLSITYLLTLPYRLHMRTVMHSQTICLAKVNVLSYSLHCHCSLRFTKQMLTRLSSNAVYCVYVYTTFNVTAFFPEKRGYLSSTFSSCAFFLLIFQRTTQTL